MLQTCCKTNRAMLHTPHILDSAYSGTMQCAQRLTCRARCCVAAAANCSVASALMSFFILSTAAPRFSLSTSASEVYCDCSCSRAALLLASLASTAAVAAAAAASAASCATDCSLKSALSELKFCVTSSSCSVLLDSACSVCKSNVHSVCAEVQ
jgi:hypothetical protein